MYTRPTDCGPHEDRDILSGIRGSLDQTVKIVVSLFRFREIRSVVSTSSQCISVIEGPSIFNMVGLGSTGCVWVEFVRLHKIVRS